MAINDVPAQSDFYSTANGRLLNDLLRSARDADKVALLLKVWRQRLSYRLVRSAEEQNRPLQRRQRRNRAAVYSGRAGHRHRPAGSGSRAGSAPDPHYGTGAARARQQPDHPGCDLSYRRQRPFAADQKALAAQLPGIPLAGGDDFGSVTAGLARWAQVVFR